MSIIELISFGLVFDFPDFKSFRTVSASVKIIEFSIECIFVKSNASLIAIASAV